MDLLSPAALLFLGLVPILVAVRLWMLRRRRPSVRYSSLSLVHEAVPRSSRIRRHLPFALFALALASLVLAMARPVSIVSVPAGHTTVILAMDVSRSMCATDIPPNRLIAAETAAASFIERHGSTTQIGIVAFAGFAEIVQSPTTDQEVLLDVVQSLTTGRRTAVGSAILESLDAIAEFDGSIAPSQTDDSPPETAPSPVPSGAYAPAIIVLLTDGASNAGPLPAEAAQQAADRGRPRLHDRVRNGQPRLPPPGLRAAVHRARAGSRPGPRWLRWLRGRRWRRRRRFAARSMSRP